MLNDPTLTVLNEEERFQTGARQPQENRAGICFLGDH